MTRDPWAETQSSVYGMQPSAGPSECSGGAWRTVFVASAEGWRAGTKSLPGEEMPSLADLEAGPFLHWPPVAPSAACSRGRLR